MDIVALSSIATFTDAYGGVDTQLEIRCLGWSVLFALMLLGIGLESRPTYEVIGRSTLANAIEYATAAS